MSTYYTMLPDLELSEYRSLDVVSAHMTEEQKRELAVLYGSRRKDPQTIMLLTLLGFLGVNGIHRFIIDQPGMGVLYLLTMGLCLIGTIVDLVNYKKLTNEYNERVAREAASILLHRKS
jgi:TM2 domain-containing membrane protein YozV